MMTFSIQLKKQTTVPIYLQIYRRIREAILAGTLQTGARLPAIRNLASELDVARGTVETAYHMLINEGYLMSAGAGGTRVSACIKSHVKTVSIEATQQTMVSGLKPPETSYMMPLKMGLPALDVFPQKLWTRLVSQEMVAHMGNHLSESHSSGYPTLKVALANYLALSRGIHCYPEQIIICAGYRGAIDLIYRTLWQAGDQCWFEEPGYLYLRQQLIALGIPLVPIAVDEEGLNIQQAIETAPKARFAVVTPSHQSPTGVDLSLGRRCELLDWAVYNQSWVIEDDYDSEYRYQGYPLPALKSLDQQDRVIYAGSFSKVLYPGLRLGYLVVPVSQIKKFQQCASLFHRNTSSLMQAVIAEFMNNGHFSRHLKKMRHLYAKRRSYLMSALSVEIPDHLIIRQLAGGMHIVADIHGALRDYSIQAQAYQAGIAAEALSSWYMHQPKCNGLLMGFTNIKSQDEANSIAKQLGQIITTMGT